LLPVRSRDPWPVLSADPCWLRDRTRLCFIPGAHPGVIFACNADAISALDLRVGPIQKLEEALFSMSKATPRAKAARTPGGAASKGGDRPVSRTPPALSPTRSGAPADLGTEFWALAPISLNAVDFADRRGDGTILSSGLMRPSFLGCSLRTGGGTIVQPDAPPASALQELVRTVHDHQARRAAIAAIARERSRLLRFWVEVPNTSSEIGTTPSRARGVQSRQVRSPFRPADCNLLVRRVGRTRQTGRQMLSLPSSFSVSVFSLGDTCNVLTHIIGYRRALFGSR
jgi:hypothetical protein